MPRTKHVNEKNTKQEIFTAYQELLSQVTPPTPEASAFAKEEKTVLDTASRDTVEKITTDLTKLKVSFNQTIGSLLEQLTAEADRLVTLRSAIAVAEKNLLERQKISVTAGLLERMIAAHKQEESEFETAMQEARTAWAREQSEYIQTRDRARTREEEEYTYQKQLEKKRDADAHAALISELTDLRKKVAAAPAELEKAVKQAVTTAVAQAQGEAATKAQFIKQQTDAELNLASVKIDTLEGVVKSQAAEIVLLKKQLDEATRQVKDIAVSVIASAKSDAPQTP